jgi:hypothetical protein
MNIHPFFIDSLTPSTPASVSDEHAAKKAKGDDVPASSSAATATPALDAATSVRRERERKGETVKGI